jgi:hypothetical protein
VLQLAVVEDHVPSSECPKCGGQMDDGHAAVGDPIRYVSNKQTGALRSPTIVRYARACLSCGYVELFLAPKELAGNLPR